MKMLMTLLLIFAVMLAACSADNRPSKQAKLVKKQQQIITVTLKVISTPLFYDGTIAPIRIFPVTSKVQGTVLKMFFHYGDNLKKGQLLAVIRSAELDKDYRQALTAYLTAKEKYLTSKANIEQSKQLNKHGIISDDQYSNDVTTLNNDYLGFLQAEHNLIDILEKVGIAQANIEALKIGETAAVSKAIAKGVSLIDVVANANGIALKPAESSTTTGSTDSAKPIKIGSEVKAGQFLVGIGDMSGISITVNVNEININQVKIGAGAVVTSPAFPGIQLQGEVTSISKQANVSDSGGALPTFPIEVVVKKLTPAQQQVIHVGMSSKIKLLIKHPQAIMIPIDAISEENGVDSVNIINPKTGKITKTTIKTGATTENNVIVLDGLKAGDKIVISH